MAAGYPLGAVAAGIDRDAARSRAEPGDPVLRVRRATPTAVVHPARAGCCCRNRSATSSQRRPDERARAHQRDAACGSGHRARQTLPAADATAGCARARWIQLFSPRSRARRRPVHGRAISRNIMTFYFLLKWIPKIVVDMGFEPSSRRRRASSGLNVGGASRCAACSACCTPASRARKAAGDRRTASSLTTVMVIVFGRSRRGTLPSSRCLAAGAGFFCNAGIVGLYAMFAQSLPDQRSVRKRHRFCRSASARGGAALGSDRARASCSARGRHACRRVATIMALGSARWRRRNPVDALRRSGRR